MKRLIPHFYEHDHLIIKDSVKALKYFLKEYIKKNNLKILDVGCGDKPYLPLFEGSNYIGLDINKNEHIDVVGDAQKIPFKDNKFDAVICTQVLEHVPHPRVVVSEIQRVLKGCGFVFVSLPLTFPLHGVPYDYWRFTEPGVKQLFSCFRNVEIRKSPSGLYTVFQLLNSLICTVRAKYFVPFYHKTLYDILDGLYPLKYPIFTINNLLALIVDLFEYRYKEKGNGAFPINYFVIAEK